jgi:hypothetical protein
MGKWNDSSVNTGVVAGDGFHVNFAESFGGLSYFANTHTHTFHRPLN